MVTLSSKSTGGTIAIFNGKAAKEVLIAMAEGTIKVKDTGLVSPGRKTYEITETVYFNVTQEIKVSFVCGDQIVSRKDTDI